MYIKNMRKKTVIAIAAAAVAIAAIIFNASNGEKERREKQIEKIKEEIESERKSYGYYSNNKLPEACSSLEGNARIFATIGMFNKEYKKEIETPCDSAQRLRQNAKDSIRIRIESLSAALASIHQK